MSDGFRQPLRIEPTHPAFAGHFPGDPVVPGVIVLERVAAAWKAWRGGPVGSLDAKFLNPLRPGDDATIELHGDTRRVRFCVTRADGAVVAQGTLAVGLLKAACRTTRMAQSADVANGARPAGDGDEER